MNEIIWVSKLDGRYNCEVTRTGEYKGQLTVSDERGGKVLLDEEVSLAYDAMFGPDADDVVAWQEKVVAAVDGAAA